MNEGDGETSRRVSERPDTARGDTLTLPHETRAFGGRTAGRAMCHFNLGSFGTMALAGAAQPAPRRRTRRSAA